MSVVHLLVFSRGQVARPPDMVPEHRRKDGDPDRRYASSRAWWKRFNEMEARGYA
jgi:hypothetical protein